MKIYKIKVRYITAQQVRGYQQGTVLADSEMDALEKFTDQVERSRGEGIAILRYSVKKLEPCEIKAREGKKNG